jgi:hypothetical protein
MHVMYPRPRAGLGNTVHRAQPMISISTSQPAMISNRTIISQP